MWFKSEDKAEINDDFATDLNIEFDEADLNDPELLAELAAMTGELKKPAENKSPKLEIESVLGQIPPEMDDEVEVELTEEDMKDPDLLAQLAQFEDTPAKHLDVSIDKSDNFQEKYFESHSSNVNSRLNSNLPNEASTKEISITKDEYPTNVENEIITREMKLGSTNIETLKQNLQLEKIQALNCKRSGDRQNSMDHLQFAKALQERIAELTPQIDVVHEKIQNNNNAYDIMTKSLEERVVDLKKAALSFKKAGQLELARDMLSKSKFIQVELNNRMNGLGNPDFVLPKIPNLTPVTIPFKSKIGSEDLEESNSTSVSKSIVETSQNNLSNQTSSVELIEHLSSVLDKQIELCSKLAAQYFTSNEKEKALEFHKRKKAIQMDKDTLISMKNLPLDSNPMPFSFNYTYMEYTIAQTHNDVPLDQINIQIKLAKDILIKNLENLETMVVFDFGWPSNSEGTVAVGKGETLTVCGSDPKYEFSTNIKIERTRAFQRFLERKKAVFEVYYVTRQLFGIMSKRNLFGKVVIKLESLLQEREIHGMLPIMDAVNPRKSTGAVLEVHLRLRTPLLKPHMLTTSEKWLNISFGSSPLSSNAPTVVKNVENKSETHVKHTVPSGSTSEPAITKAEDVVIELENSFFNPDLIVSNQVLESEHARICAEIASGKAKGEAYEDLLHQKQGYEIKMQMLVTSIQIGNLTLPAYLSQVKESIKLTKQQALEFKRHNKLDLAKRALVRVKIMTAEVEEAEAAIMIRRHYFLLKMELIGKLKRVSVDDKTPIEIKNSVCVKKENGADPTSRLDQFGAKAIIEEEHIRIASSQYVNSSADTLLPDIGYYKNQYGEFCYIERSSDWSLCCHSCDYCGKSKPFSFRPPENISTPVVKEKEKVVQLSPCQTTANFDNCAVFSHFNMPPWIPDDFLNISPSDSLERFSFECNCLVKYLKFTAKEDEIREQVFLKVKQTIEGYDSSLRVDMFGSCATGLYLSHSDIDCVISDKYASGRSQIIEKQKVNILKGILRVFRPYNPTLIRANLPIVKMIDPLHKIQIDVSVNYVESSCAAVPIIKRMASQLPGFTGLVFLLKQFLHNRGLDSNATQGIGGYGLLLWIGSFLRIHDTIYKGDNSELDNEESTGRASNIHPLDLIDGNIDKDCYGQADDIGVLFLHFLHFFGFCFDYHKVALAPGGSKNDPERILIPKLELERKYALRLAIMDPLDSNNNVTRGTTRITQIIFCFREAYQVLVAGLKNAKGKNKRKGILRLVMNTHLTSRTPDENKLNTKRNLKIADQDSGKKIKKLKKSATPQSDTYSIPVQSTKPLQRTQKKRIKKSKPNQIQPKTNNASKKVKSSAVSQGNGSMSRYFITSNNSIEVETVSTSNPGHVFDSQNDFVSLD